MLYTLLVNWNGWQDTIPCVASLEAARHRGQTVVICDNLSADDSVAELTRWADARYRRVEKTVLPRRARQVTAWEAESEGAPFQLVLIEANGNLGFAGGNNVALEVALADSACSYVFLLNNDTEVEAGALEALTAKLNANPDMKLCGPTLIYHDNENVVQGAGGTYNKLVGRARHLLNGTSSAALPSEAEIDPLIEYVMGAALFARAELLRRTGGLSEDYFLYYEELDLSRQLKPGERMGWARHAIVRHKVGGSIGTGAKRARASDLSIYYNFRSKTRYYWTHLRGWTPFLLGDLAKTSLAYLRRGDTRAVRVIWQAVFDFASKPASYRRSFTTIRPG